MNTGVGFLYLGMVMCACNKGCITDCGHIKKDGSRKDDLPVAVVRNNHRVIFTCPD